MSEGMADRFNRRRAEKQGTPPVPPVVVEDWQACQAEHLRRQTRAIESIRGMLVFFTILVVLGILFQILAIASS